MKLYAGCKPSPKLSARNGSAALCVAISVLGYGQSASAGGETALSSQTYPNIPGARNPDGFHSATGAPGNPEGIRSPDSSAKNGYKVLYRFPGNSGGSSPFNTVLVDSSDNLYGVTYDGGAHVRGAVYKLAHDGTVTILYSFTGGADGSYPTSLPRLTIDKNGNLYGTTVAGGSAGQGVVFRLAPDGTESSVYSFTGGNDGGAPFGGVISRKGVLYGTTSTGGADQAGVVYKLTLDGTETVLHAFGGGGNDDGNEPEEGLLADKQGNLFGTTTSGGTKGDRTSGTVFEVPKHGEETLLYSFQGGTDGGEPGCALIGDSSGNLYGTTTIGGQYSQGVVFEVADGAETVLYSFQGGADGSLPWSLVMDTDGNLYGTTKYGGGTGCGGGGCGTVFKLAPDHTETILHAFQGGSDGALPDEGLSIDKKGNLFGTTEEGGTGCDGDGCGTIFMLKKNKY